MKIKFDFVSNSSSTSFVYISDEELSEEAFFKAVGVDKNGPVGDLFCQMYHEINHAIYCSGDLVTTKEAVDRLVDTHSFTPDVIEKMKDAIEQGKKVVTSTLNSDGALAESFLCMAIFEIESEDFYINAYDNGW
ncbi:hypothetical protein GCM10023211_08830 [Orbus sasakiae]|uniref:Uncharacterized protein n=1 Tax=Orbus sasakiae TaxID=1078475 RepID=A0ABP9N4M6_9GAMM